MEPLWSPGVATGGNQRQIDATRKPRKQVESVATGCHQLPETFHGKEGVDGSSPSEGFHKKASKWGFFVASISRLRTSLERPSTCPQDLSPTVRGALESWLNKRRLTSSSTSMNGRYPATEGRKDIDASDTPLLDGLKLAEVDRFALWSGS